MGAQLSRLPLEKLDCRKAFRKRQPRGEALGDGDESDRLCDSADRDNVPLMGLSSDADDGDISHNPDAWITPMNMASIDAEGGGEAAASSKTKQETSKKKKKEAEPPEPEKTEPHDNKDDIKPDFATTFGKNADFTSLDTDGFQVGSGTEKVAVTEASETASDAEEKETKPKPKSPGARRGKPKSGGKGGRSSPKKSGHHRKPPSGESGAGNGGEGSPKKKSPTKKRKKKPSSAGGGQEVPAGGE